MQYWYIQTCILAYKHKTNYSPHLAFYYNHMLLMGDSVKVHEHCERKSEDVNSEDEYEDDDSSQYLTKQQLVEMRMELNEMARNKESPSRPKFSIESLFPWYKKSTKVKQGLLRTIYTGHSNHLPSNHLLRQSNEAPKEE